MLFSSLEFLFVFLPILIIVYFFAKNELKNYVLLAFSLFFYAWGEPKLIWVMLFIILVNYLGGLTINLCRDLVFKRLSLLIVIIINIGILGYFKYTNFIINNINKLLAIEIAMIDVIMPIGISFFTFQALSYSIDVYRGDTEVQKDPYKLALYISLFPQLIAGPIVKYHDVYKQIEHRIVNNDDLVYGVERFIIGLSKKVIVANTMGAVADKIYGTELIYITPLIAWIGSICYAIQLYYDFSGYSDMAIGLGKIFGFTFLENFNNPYISKSITEFWRRWHISLGTWFREYLYIPLGGNRKSNVRTYINLIIVFFVTGLWHGAQWTFVIWGLWHGLFLVIERLTGFHKKTTNKVLSSLYTLLVVNFGWVIFRSENLKVAIEYIKTMIFLGCEKIEIYGLYYFFNNKAFVILILGIIFATPVYKKIIKIIKEKNNYLYTGIYYIVILGMFLYSLMHLAASTYNPFIYFRF